MFKLILIQYSTDDFYKNKLFQKMVYSELYPDTGHLANNVVQRIISARKFAD